MQKIGHAGLLSGHCRPGNNRRFCLFGHPRLHQAVCDFSDLIQAHQKDTGLLTGCHRPKIDLCQSSRMILCRYHMKSPRNSPVRNRYSGIRQSRDTRADSRNYGKRHAAFPQIQPLFTTAPKHKGISAFQTHNHRIFHALFYQKTVDFLLRHRMIPAGFSGIYQFAAAFCFCQQLFWYQPVVHDAAGFPQSFQSCCRNQAGITGAGADQVNRSRQLFADARRRLFCHLFRIRAGYAYICLPFLCPVAKHRQQTTVSGRILPEYGSHRNMAAGSHFPQKRSFRFRRKHGIRIA